MLIRFSFSQSNGTVKYIDYTSVRPTNECPVYDTKKSDGKVLVILKVWGMRITSSLPSFQGSLWLLLVAPDRIENELKGTKLHTYARIVWIQHHHHVVQLARISLTLSRYFSLSFIASGRSSGIHPVSSHSCCMYVRADRSAFAQPYVGVHRSTLLISSSLLPQQCHACLVRLTSIVFVMRGGWPYSWCLVGCWLQDLFNIVRRILV